MCYHPISVQHHPVRKKEMVSYNFFFVVAECYIGQMMSDFTHNNIMTLDTARNGLALPAKYGMDVLCSFKYFSNGLK